MLGSIIAKYIEKNIDKVCEIFLGDIYDEFDEKYSDVYKYEIQEYLCVIESSVNELLAINNEITHKDMKTILIKENSFYGNLDKINFEQLNVFVKSLLEECLSKYYTQNNTNIDKNLLGDNLSEEELEFIKTSICVTYNIAYKRLTDIIINKETHLSLLKNSDREDDRKKYKNIVDRLKHDFIVALNTQYKLYGEIPKKDSIFEGICKRFNIKRNEFLF